MPYQTAAYYLIILEGPGKGTTHAVSGTQVTIGRQADNQIVINDHRISRHHAQLSWRGSGYLLEDLGSANGTWVNGAKVTSPVTLRTGDTIGVSQDVKLLFSDQPDASDHTYMAPAGSLSGTGTGYGAPAGAMVPQVPAVPTAPPSEGSQGLMAFGIGGLIALVGALALVAVGAAVYFLSKPGAPATESVDATALAALSMTQVAVAQTQAAAVTPTPYPTATPYPTYTAFPTNAPTWTPYPTYTPYPTVAATWTPYPTYTLYPTFTSEPTKQPTDTPRPPPAVVVAPTATTTTQPPATPKPLYDVSLGRNVVYENWGIPTNPDGCNGPYWDEGSHLKRLTVEVIVVNNSTNFIPDKWMPTFISASGAPLKACIWYYNNTVVEPREMVDVTFATHLDRGDYVRAMVFDFPGQSVTVCMGPGGNSIPCQ